MFTGNYKFQTEAIIDRTDIAFLYSKLEDEDRDFVFTTDTTSWRRLELNNQAATDKIYTCVQIPEPYGVYATEADAMANYKKPGVISFSEGGDGSADIPEEMLGTLFYEISVTPGENFFNIFEVVGYSTHPTTGIQINLGPIYYGFWSQDSGLNIGIAATERPEYCPLFKGLTVPDGLFRVGYVGDVAAWKGASYIPPDTSNDLRYEVSDALSGGDDEDWFQQDQNVSVTFTSRQNIVADVNLITPGLGCSDGLNNDAWYGGELPHRYQHGFFGNDGTNPDGSSRKDIWLCVTCDVRQKGAVEGFLNQVISHWNIPGTVRFLRGATAFGCNVNPEGTEYPPNPDPNPIASVYSSRFKGRYSKVILNYQSKGKVKELVLPIEFPTRATKIKQINAPVEVYYPNIPVDSEGWQANEQPLISEAFNGRVSIDKDNIYVSILYGTIREWEPEKGLPDDNRFLLGLSWNPFRTHNPHIGDGFLNYATYSVDSARPVKDSWKYCRNFIIDKKTFQITSDTTLTNPSSLENTHQLTIGWTILEQQKTPRYIEYKEVFPSRSEDLVSIIEMLDSNDTGFTGNPVCYPQIAGTIRGNWRTTESGALFFPIATVPEFIKPQSLWSQKEWLFWNLLERPRKPLNNTTTSYFRFELENKFGGHGRSGINKTRFYIDLAGSSDGEWRTHENYFGEIVESEQLRGTPVFDADKNIIKWSRISHYSYPYFEPGISAITYWE